VNDFDNLSEKFGASVPVAESVPIYRKMTLTVREAAEYSNIGINKIDSMLRSPNCPFVLFVGTKKLVKRCEFEEYIRGKLVI
jgi:excisionase family DNA binding protein